MENFMNCVRKVVTKKNERIFGDEPGETSFLIVPEDATDFSPKDKAKDNKTWLAKLLAGRNIEDILIYVHGYDMDRENTLYRHKLLKKGLAENGWKGELVTFVWPSGTQALLYWEDRFDALNVAAELVKGGIKYLVDQINSGCTINVHVIAHSTGALIVRESFNQARTTQKTAESNWTTSQLIFIAGDVSSLSMETEKSQELYIHCARLTNYFSNYDSILGISNAKRLGFANRVGRVGLPVATPEKAIDINCSDYYIEHENTLSVKNAFKPHSWYFWSKEFLMDLVYTLQGNLDRNVIPTREKKSDGELYLKK